VTADNVRPWAPPVALAVLTAVGCLYAVGLTTNLTLSTPLAVVNSGTIIWVVGLLGLPAVGALVAARQPANRVGHLLLGIGLAFGLALALTGIGRQTANADPETSAKLTVLTNGLWKVGFVQIPLLVLLFPTGRLPSRGWRPVFVALLALAGLAIIAGLIVPGPADAAAGVGPENPWAVPALAPITLPIVGGPGFAAFGALAVICALSAFARFRHADQKTRAQLLWFVMGSAVLAVALVIDGLLQLWRPEMTVGEKPLLLNVLQALGFFTAAAAIAIAILRYRLFDVDRVASRAIAYGALAALITALYIGLVVVVGALLEPVQIAGVVSPFVAAAIVAVAFHPLRTGLIRLADRLVYGHRATPYEVLAQTTRRVAGSMSVAEGLPVLARTLGEAIGSTAEVWIPEGLGWRRGATWPANSPPTPPDGDGVVAFHVRHGNEVLGALTVCRDYPLTPTEQRLVADLAAQAGIVMRNTALMTQLQETAARLVKVQDTTRRRLERNLHDGAQQRLTAMVMKLGLARSQTDPQAVSALLDELAADTGAALDELRDLARGMFPPLLAAQGLRAALAALCRQTPVPTLLSCTQERFPTDIEVAVYFCCAEALQNVASHAAARHSKVHVWLDGSTLRLAVSDDGSGFTLAAIDPAASGLQGMRDRLSARGGGLDVLSSPGRGTRVEGWLPVPPAASPDQTHIIA
jgi:signal transduction histidine kinase